VAGDRRPRKQASEFRAQIRLRQFVEPVLGDNDGHQTGTHARHSSMIDTSAYTLIAEECPAHQREGKCLKHATALSWFTPKTPPMPMVRSDQTIWRSQQPALRCPRPSVKAPTKRTFRMSDKPSNTKDIRSLEHGVLAFLDLGKRLLILLFSLLRRCVGE